ncbi:hypothetical protein SXCC_00691 [Gluconacetobacter sp. SXCC-1]|nr:hypothetical protein SXCC_00691 [Gluconacetobacter sp. SXCC-1]
MRDARSFHFTVTAVIPYYRLMDDRFDPAKDLANQKKHNCLWPLATVFSRTIIT